MWHALHSSHRLLLLILLHPPPLLKQRLPLHLPCLLHAPWSKSATRTRHLRDHLFCDFGRLGGDGLGVFGGGAVAARVRVAAGGDEEGEVEESVRGGSLAKRWGRDGEETGGEGALQNKIRHRSAHSNNDALMHYSIVVFRLRVAGRERIARVIIDIRAAIRI